MTLLSISLDLSAGTLHDDPQAASLVLHDVARQLLDWQSLDTQDRPPFSIDLYDSESNRVGRAFVA
jgi:hypothetical protein